jgi:outer membrane protein OmpA-like peptidoglycan-associated protein
MKGQIADLDRGVADARGRADEAMNAANTASAKVDTVDQRINQRISSLDVWKLENTQAVLFRVGSARLTAEGKTLLDELAAKTTSNNGYLIEIQGFTDSTGSPEANRRLSEARAKAVFQYLAEKEVPIHKMQIVGFGEAKPIAENTTRAGRQENRRVEVRLLTNEALRNGTVATSPNGNGASQDVRANNPQPR